MVIWQNWHKYSYYRKYSKYFLEFLFARSLGSRFLWRNEWYNETTKCRMQTNRRVQRVVRLVRVNCTYREHWRMKTVYFYSSRYSTVNDWSLAGQWLVILAIHDSISAEQVVPNTVEPGPVGICVCPTFRIPRRKVNLFPPPHNPLDVILTWPVNSCRTIKPTGSGKRVSLATDS